MLNVNTSEWNFTHPCAYLSFIASICISIIHLTCYKHGRCVRKPGGKKPRHHNDAYEQLHKCHQHDMHMYMYSQSEHTNHFGRKSRETTVARPKRNSVKAGHDNKIITDRNRIPIPRRPKCRKHSGYLVGFSFNTNEAYVGRADLKRVRHLQRLRSVMLVNLQAI